MILAVVLMAFFVAPIMAIAGSETDCSQAVTLIKAQKKQMSRDLRQIKRELAQIKNAIEEPGPSEILGGIGYIIGMFGISYYWLARNRSKENK